MKHIGFLLAAGLFCSCGVSQTKGTAVKSSEVTDNFDAIELDEDQSAAVLDFLQLRSVGRLSNDGDTYTLKSLTCQRGVQPGAVTDCNWQRPGDSFTMGTRSACAVPNNAAKCNELREKGAAVLSAVHSVANSVPPHHVGVDDISMADVRCSVSEGICTFVKP